MNAQEIRHCIAKPRSRAFLKALVELPEFDRATLGRLKNHKRMVDKEIALRFVAFWNIGYRHYLDEESEGTLNGFLLTAIRRLDDESSISDDDLSKIRSAFRRGLENATIVFGDKAFRKWPLDDTERTKPFNRALFETWTTELARVRDRDLLAEHAKRLQKDARQAFTDDAEYLDSVSSGTSDPRRVTVRFERTRAIIKKALQ